MLCNISIENVAVIERATAEFVAGFNVLTGETGAGKSILIDSINAILGNRTSKDIVRAGADKARIWATFQNIPKRIGQSLEEAGYPLEDELLIQREIGADGKSSCRVNNMPATAALLRELCSGLINIHGQHDNQSLLNPAKHLHVLDAFAQNEALLAEYGREYQLLLETRSQYSALDMDEGEKARRLDLLRYVVEEINDAELDAEEHEALVERRSIIHHSQQIVEALGQAYTALAGSEDGEYEGAAAMLGSAAGNVSEAARYVQGLAPSAESLKDLYYTAKDIASELQNNLSEYEFNPAELEQIEERLDLVYRLEQKYGKGIEAILAHAEEAQRELEGIEFSAQRLEELKQKGGLLRKKCEQLAQKLTESRKAAFNSLNQNILQALEFLNMPGIRLELKLETGSLGPHGQDRLEFYITTNPGEEPKPMAKIASGGELSRIMLAFKSALADRDEVPTVIYDEIDTGISGLASGRIGQMLKTTAKGRQVICVTHTAQVAAYADHHLLIDKQIRQGRTFTQIISLASAQREEELARIISGENATDTTKASVRELLEKAKMQE